MAANLSKIATDIARRWIATEDKRAKKGKSLVDLNFENMRDFGAIYADELDATQLDIVTDLAVQKVANARLALGAA